MKHKITRFFQNEVTGWLLLPVIIALPFAVIICVLMPDINNKYRVDFINSILMNKDSFVEYDDMDNDGWSDHYFTGYYNGKAFLTAYRNRETLDQRNYEGFFLYNGIRSITGDYDGDGIKEWFLFICRNDSLFINGLTFPSMKPFPVGGKFIYYLPGAVNRGYSVYSPLLIDLNNDSKKEIVFLVAAGYELYPREVFAYNVDNNSIIESPYLGTGVGALHPFYLNGNPYFSTTQYASMNHKDTTMPLHDNSVYFMLIDRNLQFKFKPIEYKGVHQSMKMLPVEIKGTTFFVDFISGDSLSKNLKIQLRDTSGKILYQREYYRKQIDSFDFLIGKADKDDITIIVQNNNSLEVLNSKLELIRKSKLKVLGVTNESQLDFDNDGVEEFLFISNIQGEYLICRNNLEHPVKFKVSQAGKLKNVSIRSRGDYPPYFLLHVDDIVSTFQYSKNPWYILRYPVWAGVYLVILGFIFLIRRMQRIQLRRRYAMRQKMTELKLLSIRNQMDPHFTFNVLNAIGSVILQNKPEESYSMLMKYSKLLRSTYSASDKIYRTLAEELIFVTNYLELQKMRYHDHLKYRLELDEDVDQEIIVPKMVLQTYTENAIKHGIMRKTGGGSIDIRLFMENENLVITVKDDGIGRKRAAELRTSDSGQGLNIMHDCYSMVNRLNDKPITEEFTDLYDDSGEPAGTLVTIKIPVNLSVSIS